MRKYVYNFSFLIFLSWSLNYATAKVNDEGCGVVPQYESKRIVGGSQARPWPWMGAIIMIERNFFQTRWGEFCGASLIDDKWLLTAAHCVIDEENSLGPDMFNYKALLGNIKVVLGQTNVGSAPGYTHVIKRAHVHPRYNPTTTDFDVALLELLDPVTTTDAIKPVCLDLNEDFKCSGTSCPSCMASGWGSTDSVNDPATSQLREVERHMTSNIICKMIYQVVTKRMQCYGTGRVARGVCSGDSGGPIMCQRDDVWYQSAVISRGLVDRKGECGRKMSFGLHTKLSDPDIRDWMLFIINHD